MDLDLADRVYVLTGAGRGLGRAARVWKRRPARSGAQASFVASPAQTRSQSAGSATSGSSPVSPTRSCQNSALRLRTSRMRSCASSSGRGAAPGRPSAGASSRKYTATRSSPAPIQSATFS